MNDEHTNLMKSGKELILQLTLEAMELEQIVAKATEPLRSQYRAKIQALREAAWNEEMKLKKLEMAAGAGA
jgi:hypothetical protein